MGYVTAYGRSLGYRSGDFRGGQQAKRARRSSYRRPTGAARQGYYSVPRTTGWVGTKGEMKYFDCELPLAAIPSAATAWPTTARLDPNATVNLGSAAVATPLCLFAPTVGSAVNQRIGRSVKVWKIKVRGFINIAAQAAASTADNATHVRVLMLVDQQTNAAVYTPADVLQNPVGSVATCSFQSPNGFGRFRVLKDKVLCFHNANMTGSPTSGDVVQSGLLLPFKFTHNFKKPMVVNFNQTNGGTLADIVDNSIHIMAGASNVAYVPSIAYYSRVAYSE